MTNQLQVITPHFSGKHIRIPSAITLETETSIAEVERTIQDFISNRGESFEGQSLLFRQVANNSLENDVYYGPYKVVKTKPQYKGIVDNGTN